MRRSRAQKWLLAAAQGCWAVELLVLLALAQALGVWQNQSVIAERASRACREDFLRFTDQVPDHEPAEGDKVK